jgi:DNA-binding transcriptional MerR regulator
VLLRLRDVPSQTCAEVNQLLDEHIGHVAERMRELRSLEKQLKALREQCREGSTASECGIFNQLNREAGSGSRQLAARNHVLGAHGRGG